MYLVFLRKSVDGTRKDLCGMQNGVFAGLLIGLLANLNKTASAAPRANNELLEKVGRRYVRTYLILLFLRTYFFRGSHQTFLLYAVMFTYVYL